QTTRPAAVAASPTPKPSPAPAPPETSKKFPKYVTKLIVDDLQSGRGRVTKPGSRMVVHYTSWLYDPTQPLGRGPQFESTRGKEPYKFVLQNTDEPHIRGWEDGLLNMKSGGRRRLIIPPELGYGTHGAGQVVPPNATLMYEIELLDVE
ncbi:MAG: FKBP-type peptidyl-prolyl cis-trans isomerase, partial [Bdellovibrionales bacterium]|nr:FKBP-type peptidyl-prolyl cis-trans isomerase [Bdellovibrionales bacterium]